MAATISDMYTGATDAPSNICSAGSAGRLEPDENQRDRASRICFLGVATSVISVFTALTLIQMEMVILCAPGSVSFSRRHNIIMLQHRFINPWVFINLWLHWADRRGRTISFCLFGHVRLIHDCLRKINIQIS